MGLYLTNLAQYRPIQNLYLYNNFFTTLQQNSNSTKIYKGLDIYAARK
jgi:hypothetical protein